MPDSIDVSVTVTPKTVTGSKHISYHFDCAPDVVVVTKSDTTINYVLSPDTPANLILHGIFHTDSKYQLSEPVYAPDGRSVSLVHRNSHRHLICLAMQVKDVNDPNSSGAHDPQIINIPDNP